MGSEQFARGTGSTRSKEQGWKRVRDVREDCEGLLSSDARFARQSVYSERIELMGWMMPPVSLEPYA